MVELFLSELVGLKFLNKVLSEGDLETLKTASRKKGLSSFSEI